MLTKNEDLQLYGNIIRVNSIIPEGFLCKLQWSAASKQDGLGFFTSPLNQHICLLLVCFYVISGLLIMPEKVATLKKENIELLKSQIGKLSSELKNLKWQSFLVFY